MRRVFLTALAAFAPLLFARLAEWVLWYPWKSGPRAAISVIALCAGVFLAFCAWEDSGSER
jgi:hypothetical protein